MLSVAEAQAGVLKDVGALAPETVALRDAHGRVLAADLAALRTQPPAAVSAMDGYAVRSADVARAPARLRLIGEVAAGHPFDSPVGPGEAARIFTGGVLPPGADTVVVQEITAREGDAVVVQKTSAPGRHIRPQGLDFKAGEALLRRGHRLTARDLALAAAMNHPVVPVHRRPKVAVLATGDELVLPGEPLGHGQIVYSNGFALMAQVAAEGAEVIDLGIAPDRLDATVAAVRRARGLDVDVLVTTGGASVGDHDLVQKAFAAEGMALSFWKVALRPGRPLMHGRLARGGAAADANAPARMDVLGLPGNPVSAFVCGVLFLVPLLRRLAGRTDLGPDIESATLGRALPANDERTDYMRAALAAAPDGSVVATPFETQDSSMLAPLAQAGCLVIREPYAPAAAAGAPCRVVKLAF
ncbi:MAG TPA: gephyrin-like molybdotransferase Glp [Xanthobacteraceae bacterium]|nr:gephyrin-like molybdotransferase Glp [Xanthobacteraceae bacterium]